MTPNRGTRFALLGLLTVEPMTGYDMQKFIKTSIGHFWHESFANIYPVLHQLEREKLVEIRMKPGTDRPNRKVYRLTEEGRTALRAWQCESVSEDRVKSELLLKLFFGNQLSRKVVQSHLSDYANRQVRKLRDFAESAKLIAAAPEHDRRTTYWTMTLRYGEMITNARLAWAKESLQLIESANPRAISKPRRNRKARPGGARS